MSSRFERDLRDLPDDGVAVSRFERFDPDHTLNPHFLTGATLNVSRIESRIDVWFRGERDLRGTFPTFALGIQNLSEALQNDTPLESIDGVSEDLTDPFEQALQAGAKLQVKLLGEQIHAQIVVALPHRTFEYRGKEHRVGRVGLRQARGVDLLQTVAAAWVATDEVVEHLLYDFK